MHCANVSLSIDEVSRRVQVEISDKAVVELQLQDVVARSIHKLSSRKLKLMATPAHFVQAAQVGRVFEPVAQRRFAGRARVDSVLCAACKLPSAIAIVSFGIDAL